MKTKYRVFLVLSITILATLLITIGQAYAATDLERVPAGDRLPRFVDDKNLLTQAQARELTAKLDEISERHKFDTVVAVVHSLKSGSIKGREARLYAIDFFEQNGFGFGNDLDGIVLLLATEDRDFGFATTGYGFTAFTDAGQEYLEKLFLPHLKKDNYFEAFMAFADGVDDFVTKAKAGKPYAAGNIPLTYEELMEYRIWSVIGSLLLGWLIALIVVTPWELELRSLRKDFFANVYIREGSMALSRSKDILLFSNVTMSPRVKNDSSSGGGSSGSFRSSSGRSATGRSGKY